MPSPNGLQQFPPPPQGFPNGNGGPNTMTPEQIALFQQHRQQLLYQQQAQAQAMAMVANAQRTGGDES